MTEEDLPALNIADLQSVLRRREVSAREVIDALQARIETVDPKIGAYLSLDTEAAAQEAEKSNVDLPLGGVPLAIKDIINVMGQPCTCASRILQNYRAMFDATVIRKLRAAGAIPFGKTNMDEFAMGSSTENSSVKPTRNPWDRTRVPGGSSGGSAAAVAADEAIASLGSDTGGSIRQPAALSGVVGLKPTYGRVSRSGLVAFASSLDQIGPITKDVTDAAMLLNVIAGHDPLDSTSADVPVPDYTKALKKKDVKKLKIGLPKEYFAEGLDQEVEQAVREAAGELKKLGGEIKDVALPTTGAAIAAYYLIATAEASSNLARYDGCKYGLRSKQTKDLLEMYMKTRQEGFGPEVKRRIMLGTYALSAGYYEAYYGKAQAVRTLIRRDFEAAFQEVDLLVTPVMPTPAFKLGEKIQEPLQMYLSDIYTISANLAGIPAISVPCGYSKAGLPIGLQILGRPFEEETLLRGEHAYEQATGWRAKRPNIR